MLTRRILAADVVYNGLGTPIADGAVVVQGDGDKTHIVAVDSLQRIAARFPEATVTRVGFAISPPPVNAHTHLDLSQVPTFRGSYEAFIQHVIAHREQRSLAAAQVGLDELRTHGITTLGDIVTREEVMRWLLAQDGLRGVAYWEVIGPHAEHAERVFAETVERLRTFQALQRPGGLQVGLAPHTPHTVSAPLLQRLARLAAAERIPMQIHVAESAEEIAFHRHGSSWPRLRQLLGAWEPSGLSPVTYLARLGVLEARPTLVHMVHVDEADVRAVQQAGCVVVHCPRSNEALSCGRFPWELYAKHGVEVALGTDSRASSPDLSVSAELAAARKLHGTRVSPRALIRAAVKGGHRALGLTPPRFGRGDSAANLYVWREQHDGDVD